MFIKMTLYTQVPFLKLMSLVGNVWLFWRCWELCTKFLCLLKLAVNELFKLRTGYLYKVPEFVTSSKLQITFSPFLMMTNNTPDTTPGSWHVPHELHVHPPCIRDIAQNIFPLTLFPLTNMSRHNNQLKSPLLTSLKRDTVNQQYQ